MPFPLRLFRRALEGPVLIACWSTKGGSGTTVVSVALALLLARRSQGQVVLADLAGDVPAVLGLPEPEGPGLSDWMAAGPDVPADALGRLAVAAPMGLRLLARGSAPWDPAGSGGERLTEALARGLPPEPGLDQVVVADCGTAPLPGLAVASGATLSLLVIRPCYLALRRAVAAPVRPSGVILVSEEGRSLVAADVSDVLGVPVRAVVPYDPSVARAVDAGLLSTRVPRCLERALRNAA